MVICRSAAQGQKRKCEEYAQVRFTRNRRGKVLQKKNNTSLLKELSTRQMDRSPPAKRKKTTVEHMDIDSPRVTRSNSPLPSSMRTPSPLYQRTSSSKYLRVPSPRTRSRSPRPRSRSPRPHISTPPRSPLRPSSPLPSHLSFAPSVPSPLRNSHMEENSEQMEDTDSTQSSPTRRRKVAGGESKHNLIARVKKTLNEKLHSIKPVLLAWLQKYLGDQRLSDYINKLQFHIDPSGFGTKFPVSVVASPIIPNEQTFLKISQDLSGPILTDYPGIFLESDVPEEMKENSEAHGLQLNYMVAEVLAEIFGKCWDSLGGLIKFHGIANIGINGTHKYYDLVARYWIKEAKLE